MLVLSGRPTYFVKTANTRPPRLQTIGDHEASDMLLLKSRYFYCAFAVFATIYHVLTKISNLKGIAVQWDGCLRDSVHNKIMM